MYLVGNSHGGTPMECYCVKCREKREMKNPKKVTMKNGRPATEGTCHTCGSKMFRIGKGPVITPLPH